MTVQDAHLRPPSGDSHGVPSARRSLVVSRLCKTFAGPRLALGRRGPVIHAVRDVDLHVEPGEVLGIVGETGSGKSTVARCLSGLLRPASGIMTWGEFDLSHLSSGQWRRVRRRLQIVVQNPYGSLDPRMPVLRIVEEPLRNFAIGDLAEQRDSSLRVLRTVGLRGEDGQKLPRELSGGQRQRVAIARALVLEPDLLMLDEPVAALDVSIQAQIMALLLELQAARGMAMVVILHDLAVARYLCDRITVMHDGRVVETGETQRILSAPQHVYTRSLIAASP